MVKSDLKLEQVNSEILSKSDFPQSFSIQCLLNGQDESGRRRWRREGMFKNVKINQNNIFNIR